MTCSTATVQAIAASLPNKAVPAPILKKNFTNFLNSKISRIEQNLKRNQLCSKLAIKQMVLPYI